MTMKWRGAKRTTGATWLASLLLATALSSPAGGVAGSDSGDRYQISFIGIEFEPLIRQAEAITGKSFLYDPKTIQSKTATLISSKELDADHFYRVFEALCQIHGLALVPAPDVGVDLVRIVKNEDAVKLSAGTEIFIDQDTLPESERIVTYVARIEHVEPSQVDKALRDTIKLADITLVEGTKLLLINDHASNMPRIRKIIELVDQPGEPVAVRYVNLEHVDVGDIQQNVTDFTETLSSVGGALALAPNFSVQADERLNLFVLAGFNKDLTRVEEYIHLLDRDTPAVRRRVEFYKVRHVRVDDLARDVATLLGGRLVALPSTSSTPTPSATGSSTTSVSPNTPTRSLSFSQPTRSQAAGTPATNPPPLRTTPGGSSPLPGTLPPAGADEILVLAQAGLNTLIVAGTESVHEQVRALLEKLDVRKPQVLIEVVIAQISGDDSLDFGLRFLGSSGGNLEDAVNFGSGDELSDTSNSGTPNRSAVKSFGGALWTFTKDDTIQVILSALATEAQVNIVSQPLLLVNDNEPATFQTKLSEPTTASTFATSTTNISFSGFADATTELAITPHISDGDYLVVDISQTFEAFQGKSIAPGIPPSKISNLLRTKVTVPDLSTIIIGGFVRDTTSQRVSKIPILGDIPLLGALFSSTSESTSKSRLYLFIRPRILRDQDFSDLKRISGEKHAEIPAPESIQTKNPPAPPSRGEHR